MLELPILKQEIYGCWRMAGNPETGDKTSFKEH